MRISSICDTHHQISITVMCRRLIAILFLLPIFQTKFTVDLQLEPQAPVTIALPSVPPPWLLTSNIPLTLSISPCPLSPFPSSFIQKSTTFSLLLDEAKLKKVIERGNCSNSSINSMFVTVTSSVQATGALFMDAVAGSGQKEPIDVDGSAFFSINKNKYASFFFQLPSIEHGLKLEIGLTSGNAEVFMSFCIDFEGLNLGRVHFPTGLSKFFNPADIVNLIEKYSCDHGALYHDLEKNPPAVIIRVRSSGTSGGIVLSADQHHVYGSPLHRAAVSGDTVTLGANDTLTLDFPVGTDIKFILFSGSVQIAALVCPEEPQYELGNYLPGNHTISRNLLRSSCNVSISRIAVTWFGNEDSILKIRQETHKKQRLAWYYIAAILIGTTLLVTFGCCIICYFSHKHDERAKQKHNKRSVSSIIPMTTMTNIPFGNRWM